MGAEATPFSVKLTAQRPHLNYDWCRDQTFFTRTDNMEATPLFPVMGAVSVPPSLLHVFLTKVDRQTLPSPALTAEKPHLVQRNWHVHRSCLLYGNSCSDHTFTTTASSETTPLLVELMTSFFVTGAEVTPPSLTETDNIDATPPLRWQVQWSHPHDSNFILEAVPS